MTSHFWIFWGWNAVRVTFWLYSSLTTLTSPSGLSGCESKSDSSLYTNEAVIFDTWEMSFCMTSETVLFFNMRLASDVVSLVELSVIAPWSRWPASVKSTVWTHTAQSIANIKGDAWYFFFMNYFNLWYLITVYSLGWVVLWLHTSIIPPTGRFFILGRSLKKAFSSSGRCSVVLWSLIVLKFPKIPQIVKEYWAHRPNWCVNIKLPSLIFWVRFFVCIVISVSCDPIDAKVIKKDYKSNDWLVFVFGRLHRLLLRQKQCTHNVGML